MAASTVTTAFTEQYSANVYMLAQQKGSKLSNFVRNETISNARNAYYERLGLAEAQEMTTRHGDTPLNEIPHSRRRLTPADYNTATLIDNMDELKMLIDPQSPYANSQAMTLGRKKDDIIIASVYADVATGQSGQTSIAFKDDSRSMNGDGTITTLGTLATPQTETGMTLQKMLDMAQLFNEEDVDVDIARYWCVTPKEISDMLDLEEVGSSDYNTIKTLVQGKVDTYMGFKWVWSNRLPGDTTDGSCSRTFAWAEDGIILGTAEGMTSRITERDDKNYSTQVYTEMSCGAIRLEGAKVHEALMKIA